MFGKYLEYQPSSKSMVNLRDFPLTHGALCWFLCRTTDRLVEWLNQNPGQWCVLVGLLMNIWPFVDIVNRKNPWILMLFWELDRYSFTPLKTNISPENWWLEDAHFLLKWSPFRGHSSVFGGGGQTISTNLQCSRVWCFELPCPPHKGWLRTMCVFVVRLI